MPRGPIWSRRLSHRGEEPELEPGDLRRMRRLAAAVEDNQAAVLAARYHPKLRRGKKVAPLSLMPPRASDGKVARFKWQMAARIAEQHAEEGDE